MTKSTRLSKVEQEQIKALLSHGLTYSDVARHLNRHVSTVTRFVIRQKQNKPVSKRAPNQKLSTRMRRRIVSTALRGKQSAREIRDTLGIDLTVRRVQQVLHEAPFLQYSRPIRAPNLSKLHKEERLKFAELNLEWGHPDWTRVIFSDEKKFNLDGPDGLSSYWRDLRKEPDIFSKRQQGGGSVMVWACISYSGTLSMVGLEGNVDSKYYCDVLEDALLPQANELYQDWWTFVQDNASVHNSEYTRAWLDSNDVHVLPWPARSPDLNIIENVWGAMARHVYAHGRQFADVDGLTDAIQSAWNSIATTYVKNLYHSIPRRLISVIKKKGGSIDY